MFGLQEGDMATWLNQLAERVRTGSTLTDLEQVKGVLPTAPLTMRAIDRSWYPELFGYAMWFAQHPPLPVIQAVWPDRHSLFPWQEGVGDRCRLDQPQGWTAMQDHPTGPWTVGLGPWPFEELPDAFVYSTKRILHDGQPAMLVAHDHEGEWQILDGGLVEPDDVVRSHFRHLVGLNPRLVELADLAIGWEAERFTLDGPWVRSEMSAD